MTAERLDASDKKALLIWLLAGLLAAAVAYKYFYRAFPEASVEFKVPRAAALGLARQFAASQGALLDGYQSSIIFDVDDTAKTYLEREVGLEQANRMMARDVHIWYWQVRFFRPLQKEEFDVRVDPGGQIVGYAHVQEEAAPGAHLERAAAQAIAESFFSGALHADLSRLAFLAEEANSTERPNRRDWIFTWEQRDFRAKDAPYRFNVSVAGDRADGYAEYLKVPEAWTNDYERLRSSNDLIEYLALIPYALLLGACLQMIFVLGRRGLLEWQGGIVLGLFLAIVYFLMTMNQWPLDRARYDTNTSYASFFLSASGKAVLVSLLSALLVVLAVVPGEPLYRASQPNKLRLGVGFRLPGIRTREFFRSNVIGICLAAVHIGYITVFYIVSGKFGAWAPRDLNYTNVVSTSLPWLYPMAIGIYAATSEEFLFRMFAIPLLLRTTQSKWLAVVLPAFAWGFLHSNYPQEPAYIRGIEVGLIGIVAGLVMLRWGIWTTLTWHYTVDAFLISTSLLRSSGAYLRVSGAIVGGAALIPLAIAAISYLSRGGFESNASLLNSARPLAAQPAEVLPIAEPEALAAARSSDTEIAAPEIRAASPPSEGISPRTLGILAAGGVLGVVLVLAVQPEAIGDFVRFQISAREATRRADQVLRENKVDPAGYHSAATITYTFDPYTNEYLRRAVGISAANRIYREQVPTAFWTVRYFRDSQIEEYLAELKPEGSFHSLHHTLDERTPGANLAKEDALARAEAYLRDAKKLDLSAWNLVETNSDKRPARTDHTFVWEQKAALDMPSSGPGAHIRVELHMQGDEVSGYRTFIKIPEAWRDAESRTTAAQIAQIFGLVVLLGAVLITVLVVFLRSLKHREIAQVPWRRLAKWSAWVLAAAVLTFINRAPQLITIYPTTEPLATYFITLSISLLFIIGLYLAGAFVLLGLSWFFLARVFGSAKLPGWLGMPGNYYRDAFCIAIFGAPALAGFIRLPGLFSSWPLLRHALAASVPGGLDALSPALSTLAASVWGSFFVVGAVALTAGFIAAFLRRGWTRAALAVLVAVLLPSNVATPAGFFRDAAFRLLVIGALWLGVTRIIRFNLLGYFLLSALILLGGPAAELLEQPNTYFHANGYALAAAVTGLLLWPLVEWRRRSSPG